VFPTGLNDIIAVREFFDNRYRDKLPPANPFNLDRLADSSRRSADCPGKFLDTEGDSFTHFGAPPFRHRFRERSLGAIAHDNHLRKIKKPGLGKKRPG
jgi:hypothetical protein